MVKIFHVLNFHPSRLQMKIFFNSELFPNYGILLCSFFMNHLMSVLLMDVALVIKRIVNSCQQKIKVRLYCHLFKNKWHFICCTLLTRRRISIIRTCGRVAQLAKLANLKDYGKSLFW